MHTQREGHHLHICPECERDLVYPVQWRQVSRNDWEVLRRCPNCEWTDFGVHDQDTVDRYDDVLDEGTGVIEHALELLQAQTMRDDVERFLGALHAGAILPEDF